MNEIPFVVELLYGDFVMPPDPKRWPEWVCGDLSMRGYQDLELGAKPKYDTLLRIAEYYDVSVDWLMGRTEKREVNR